MQKNVAQNIAKISTFDLVKSDNSQQGNQITFWAYDS